MFMLTCIVSVFINKNMFKLDLDPCDIFLFPRLQKHLAGRKYQTRKNLGSAIFQCLNSIPRKDYKNAFENWIKRLKLCVSHGGEYFVGLR